ncbi:hypothetical protein [Rhizobium leguminosarum]|uniref:hypothetical protein n=1 Tax=Rhizobium leguminosarum TaxID=384 RepID=UPI00102F8BFC|nr:hypothetical protein [Rhizobium leguminosarum]TAY66485.1 hypothetical protein ELH82_09920 [Rhizobium leguminosarum]
MTANNTIPAHIATMLGGKPTEQMSRKEFNSYLFDLYECEGQNTVTADEVHESDDFYVEVFKDSPDGPVIAVHDAVSFQLVDIYRPSADQAQEAA